MALTPEQLEALTAALNREAHDRQIVCPVSGDTNWIVFSGGLTFLEIVGDPKTGRRAEQVQPMAVVNCGTCGYTWLVNILLLGLKNELGIDEPKNG